MKEQRITVEIDREGRVSADAEGFVGDGCLKDLERILAAMASEPEEVRRKAPDGSAKVAARAAPKVTAGRKP